MVAVLRYPHQMDCRAGDAMAAFLVSTHLLTLLATHTFVETESLGLKFIVSTSGLGQ